jgi:penicillin-insensitive murein endopeptidase
MPKKGASFRFYRKHDRRYGTPEMVGLVERVADRVAADHPGSVMLVGDMSGPRGGFISEHRSHRSGRDVDLALFLTDAAGRPISGASLTRLDRFGVGVRDKATVRLDAARSWAMVEGLLADEQAQVQWIFVSRGIKALLLTWALNHGRDVDLIERALKVLHQPGDSKAHDDHLHVRIYCPVGANGRLCRDLGPVWPWIDRRAAGSRADSYTDEDLMRLALSGLD